MNKKPWKDGIVDTIRYVPIKKVPIKSAIKKCQLKNVWFMSEKPWEDSIVDGKSSSAVQLLIDLLPTVGEDPAWIINVYFWFGEIMIMMVICDNRPGRILEISICADLQEKENPVVQN